VIFDCDGVLVDSEGITNAILVENLARHGLRLTVPEVEALFVGGTMKAVGERAVTMGARLGPDWLDRTYAEMYARLALGTPLIAGIEALLDRLDAAGVPYAVGSNGPEEKMAITLGQHPAVYARLKANIFSSHTHGTAKPDPGLYLLAASKFGIAPADCAVVDDSPAGCLAGIRAGMVTYGLAEHDDGARLAALGARVIHRLADLPALLGV
jgi:HAD superfamily hydrolase (TIGR01509 family)